MSFSFKSVFIDIKKAEKTTVKWLEQEIANFIKKAPTIEKVVDVALEYIEPVLQLVLTSVGNTSAAALVTSVITQAEADLKTASALVYDFGPTPTVASIFSAVEQNLQALLSAGHVTDTKSVAAVNKVVAEIGAVAAAISAAATSVSSAVK